MQTHWNGATLPNPGLRKEGVIALAQVIRQYLTQRNIAFTFFWVFCEAVKEYLEGTSVKVIHAAQVWLYVAWLYAVFCIPMRNSRDRRA